MPVIARLALIACLLSAAFAAEPELLQNPTFTNAEHWTLPPAAKVGAVPGRTEPAILIDAAAPGWHMARQWGVKLAPGRVRASVEVKVESVSGGSSDWEKPRMQLIFLTADSKELDQPRPSAEAAAIADWQLLEINADVPAGATMAVLCIGLHGCAGKAAFVEPSLIQPSP